MSKKTPPEEERERESQIAEIMQQNSALQLRLAKAEENAKVHIVHTHLRHYSQNTRFRVLLMIVMSSRMQYVS